MLDLTKRLLAAAKGGEPVLLASILEAGGRTLTPGARLLVDPSGDVMGSLGDDALDSLIRAYATAAFADRIAQTLYVKDGALSERVVDGATSIYVEVVTSKPVFLVVGGGHIGRSLAKLANFLDYHVVVIDDREDFADATLIPEADEVICDDFEHAIDNYPIGPMTTIVLVTRGHMQDEMSLKRCLGRGAGYLGMIGSKRRTAAVLQHMQDEGFDREELDRVRTPIGLDIGAESPEEIAVAIVAEVLMLQNKADGAVMYTRPARLRS